MSKLFRPFLSLALISSLLFTASSCGGTDPEPEEEEEVITTLVLSLEAVSKGQDAEATYSTLPGSNARLNLKANTTYNATITLRDDSRNRLDMTGEISQKQDEHLFVFTPTPAALLTMSATDQDSKGLPVGLTASVVTGNAGTGTLRVVLKHQPGGLKTGTNTTAGATDIEATFEVIVAN